MLQEKIAEVAVQLNGQYNYEEYHVKSLGGSNIPVSIHNITVIYNSVEICLNYEFGNHSLGKIQSSFETSKILPEIKVSSRSPFNRLFSKGKKPFKIECDSSSLKEYVIRTLESSGYSALANRTTFEPEIHCIKRENSYELSTVFYMGFNDQEQSIIPSIEVHKQLIDKLSNE